MNEIRFSTRIKKDIKRYEHDDEKLRIQRVDGMSYGELLPINMERPCKLYYLVGKTWQSFRTLW